MASERPAADPRISVELIDALYRQVPTTISGVSVAIVLMVIFQWERQSALVLVAWVLLHALALFLRAMLARSYARWRGAGLRDPTLWARRFALLLGLSGALWAAAGVAFFDPHDPMGNAFLMIYQGGLVATVLITTSAYLPAFLAFTLPAVAPLALKFFLADAPMYRLVGFASLIFLTVCVVAARRLHRILLHSAELRFQNQDLASRLRTQKDDIEQALLAKSKFLAAASHDLRQPLHALTLFVELLDARLSGTEERECLRHIQSSSRALGGLLNALLDVARIDSHSLQQRRTHFRLAPLLGELRQEFDELAQHKGLVLTVVETSLVIESDRDLLGRILRNLLANAIRYTAAGSITLQVGSRGGGRLAISVADTGVGIPVEEQDKVFQEFYQVGNRERDRDKGLGLGLSIVRGLCQVLDHPLKLVSQPLRAVGTEFVIEVPAGLDGRAAREHDPEQAPALTGSLDGRRVLVIDDEREIRAGMAALLGNWRCQVRCAGSAQEALALVSQASWLPELVVCDYRLPEDMTGTEALRRLEDHLGRRVPGIIVSGDTSPERIREMKRAGRPLLFKPVVPGKLRAALSAALSAAAP